MPIPELPNLPGLPRLRGLPNEPEISPFTNLNVGGPQPAAFQSTPFQAPTPDISTRDFLRGTFESEPTLVEPQEERSQDFLISPLPPVSPTAEESTNAFIKALQIPEIAFFDRSVRGAVYAISKGEGILGAIERFAKGSPIAALFDAVLGTDIHENISGEQMLEALGVDDPGLISSIAAEIATGPSTYVTGGLSKLGNAVRAGKVFRVTSNMDEVLPHLRVLKSIGVGTNRFDAAIANRSELLHMLDGAVRNNADVAKELQGIASKVARGTMSADAGRKAQFELVREASEELFNTSFTKVKMPKLLREQAELGFRGFGFGVPLTNIHFGMFPKWFNVPLYTGFEKATAKFATSGLGRGLRKTFSSEEPVAKGTMFSMDLPADQAIEAQARVGEMAGEIADRIEGVRNIDIARSDEYFRIVDDLDPELRKLSNHLIESGAVRSGEVLNPQNTAKLLTANIADVFYGGARDFDNLSEALSRLPKGSVLIEDMLKNPDELLRGMSREPFTREQAAKLARTELVNSLRSAGFDAGIDDKSLVTEFIESVLKLPKKHREVFEKASEVAELGGRHNLLRTPTDTLKEMVEDGIINKGEFARLKKWRDIFDGVNAEQHKLWSTYSQLSRPLRESFNRGSQGVANLLTSTGELFVARDEAVRTLMRQGKTPLDAKVMKRLRGKAEKLFEATGTEDLADLTARMEKEVVTIPEFTAAIVGKAAEAQTQEELFDAVLYGFARYTDQLHLEEAALGIKAGYLDNYFPHVLTAAGRAVLDDFGETIMRSTKVGQKFPQARKFSDLTQRQIEAIARERGWSSLGDQTLTSWLREQAEDVSPGILKRLRVADPNAALFFEDDLAVSLTRRTIQSQAARGKALLADAFRKDTDNGGLARFVLQTDVGAEPQKISSHMQNVLLQNPGHEWIRVDDVQTTFEKLPLRQIAREGNVFRMNNKLNRNTPLEDVWDELSDAERQVIRTAEELDQFDEATARGLNLDTVEHLDGRNLQPGSTYALVNRDLGRAMKRTYEKMTSPAELGALGRLWHEAQNMWKLQATVTAPAFHFRNFQSDMMLAWLGGMRNPKNVWDAHKLIATANGKGGKLSDLVFHSIEGGISYKGDQVLQLAHQMGVVLSDYRHMDLYTDMAEGVLKSKGVRGAAFRARNFMQSTIMKPGIFVGQRLQNNIRLGMFIDQLKKGVDPLEAARWTKRHLVDYNSAFMSQFERTYMRGVMPFYTFLRRSVPLALEAFAEQPAKMAVLGKILEGVDEGTIAVDDNDNPRLPNELVPDFVKDQFGIRFREGEKGPEYFLLKSWLPQSDMVEIAQNIGNLFEAEDPEKRRKILDDFVARVSPLIKLPIETLANYSFFMRRELDQPGEEWDFLGLNMKPSQVNLLRSFRLLAEIDRLNPFDAFGERSGEFGEKSQAPGLQRQVGFLTGGKPTPVVVDSQWRQFRFKSNKKISQLKADRRRLIQKPLATNRLGRIEEIDATIRKELKKQAEVGSDFGEYLLNRRRARGE